MKNKLFIILMVIVTVILTGCNDKEQKQTSKKLVCTSLAKECDYVAVAGSEIGEEEYVCGKTYGTYEKIFNYDNENDKTWNDATFITKYDKEISTEEKYNELALNCLETNKCSITFEDGIITISQRIDKNDFQNGTYEEMLKYMNSMDYDCK